MIRFINDILVIYILLWHLWVPHVFNKLKKCKSSMLIWANRPFILQIAWPSAKWMDVKLSCRITHVPLRYDQYLGHCNIVLKCLHVPVTGPVLLTTLKSISRKYLAVLLCGFPTPRFSAITYTSQRQHILAYKCRLWMWLITLNGHPF